MIAKETLTLFEKVVSVMDSFQQDYGRCRYSATMESYVEGHRIIVTISSGWKVIRFVIDKTNENYLYQVFELKTMELLKMEENNG